jgi:hypothetical protein
VSTLACKPREVHGLQVAHEHKRANTAFMFTTKRT